jgi:uncharacterized coiled-coil protein SlyX
MTEQEEIIATLDRIIAIQDRIIERMNGMIGTIDNMIDEISSNKLNNDAVTSMRDKFKTYDGPR